MSDLDLLNSLLLVLGGLCAGFINVVAGGGSLLTMPLLIFMGLPAGLANGTIRLAILVQNITAALRYSRAGAIDWKGMPKLIVPATLGGAAGAVIATYISDGNFRSLIGWVTLVAGFVVVLDPQKYLARRNPPEHPKAASSRGSIIFAVSLVLTGLYGGLAQAGVGYIILASLVLAGGFSLVQANIIKVVLVMCFTPIALVIFALNEQINYQYAFVLTLGQACGAYLGAGFTLSKGGQYIRPILAVVIFAAAIKLVFF